jgi:hypothetical protein
MNIPAELLVKGGRIIEHTAIHRHAPHNRKQERKEGRKEGRREKE